MSRKGIKIDVGALGPNSSDIKASLPSGPDLNRE